MKPTDKAIVRMVSESPGRNASEPVGGLENTLAPEAEPALAGRRQHESSQADRSDETFRRGISTFMVKFCFLLAENLSRVLPRPVFMRVRSTFEKLRTSKSCLVPAMPG